MEQNQEKRKIGILNRGKNNQFIGNKFEGHDVGIQDEGEDTLAWGNEFDADIQTTEEKWHQRWWGKIIIGLAILLIGGFLLFIFGWN